MARGDPPPASGRVAGSPLRSAPDWLYGKSPAKMVGRNSIKSGLHVTVNAAAIVTLKNRTLSPVVERFITCARQVTKAFPGRPQVRNSGGRHASASKRR
jgi:hypothetical protein